MNHDNINIVYAPDVKNTPTTNAYSNIKACILYIDSYIISSISKYF